MEIDSIIIGAGPAGLQLAYFLKQRNTPYILLERSDHVGAFFSQYPRQRQLISINKPHSLSVSHDNSLRYDWNTLLCSDGDFKFTNYSDKFYPDASLYVTYLDDFARKYQLNMKLNTEVSCIKKNAQGLFEITVTGALAYTCRRVFLACGMAEKSVPEDVQNASTFVGATLSTYGSMTLDPEYYKNRSVVIVGTGNAAFETANYLNDFTESIAMVGPSKVAWKTHYPGHLRSKNMAFIDTLYLKMGNIIYFDDYNAAGVIYTQHTFLKHSGSKLHHVIFCGGFKCQLGFLDVSCRPNMDDRGFPVLNESFESSTKNMYFIGASMQSPDWKIGTSSFIHGFRYNIRFMDRVLHNDLRPLKFNDRAAVEKYMNMRINESSCLHHRHKWFCDILVIRMGVGTGVGVDFCYYEDIYIPYMRANEKYFRSPSDTMVVLYMDYGAEFEWSLKQSGNYKQPDIIMPFRESISKFLHPVFEVNFKRECEVTKQVFHVGESPSGQFHHPIYQSMINIYLDFAFGNGNQRDIALVECNIIQLQHDYDDYMKNVTKGNLSPFVAHKIGTLTTHEIA